MDGELLEANGKDVSDADWLVGLAETTANEYMKRRYIQIAAKLNAADDIVAYMKRNHPEAFSHD